jgi:hypothetical protein
MEKQTTTKRKGRRTKMDSTFKRAGLVGLVAFAALMTWAALCLAQTEAEEMQVGATPSIVAAPTILGAKDKSVTVYGAGFPTDSAVLVGFMGLGKHMGQENLCMAVAEPNEHGAFKVKLQTRRFRYWSEKENKYHKITPGVYTIIAESKAGPVATAPLRIEGKK